MCRYCKYCGKCEICHCKRTRPYQPRKTRVVTKGKVQKRRKINRQQANSLEKNIRKLHVGTQLDPLVLSPLYVKHVRPNCTRDSHNVEHNEITPEMIHQALRQLATWFIKVEFRRILNYILTHYPVNQDEKAAAAELHIKLRIAQLAGIVCDESRDYWRLSSCLERLREIPEGVITLFWEVYCYCMDPLQIRISVEFSRASCGLLTCEHPLVGCAANIAYPVLSKPIS